MPRLTMTALFAAACALGSHPVLHAQDLPQAERQFAARDFPGVIDTLLPAREAGQLEEPQALMWLGIACEQAKVPPRNRAHPCSRSSAEIMVEAAERGHPEAMYLASIGLMNTGAGRIGLSIPFLDDSKRVNALMWATLAARFADSEDLHRRASARAADLARPLAQEMRGQETLGQRAMRMAEAKRQAFEMAGLVAYDIHAGQEAHDEEMGEEDFEIPMVEDRQAIRCGGVVGRGGSVTVEFGPKRAQEEAYDFGVWRESDSELFYLSVDWGDAATTERLNPIQPTQFRRQQRATVPTSVTAIANKGDGKRRIPVFTTPGTYAFYISPAFDSHIGGYICTVEYRP